MKNKISVIGLGYVGLPLATEFAKQYKVVGFDIDKLRIKELEHGEDKTREINILDFNKVVITKKEEFLSIESGLFLSSNPEDITDSSIYIINVKIIIGYAMKKYPRIPFLGQMNCFVIFNLNVSKSTKLVLTQPLGQTW